MAYGYRCPGGDVYTLRMMYQENMTDAPTDEPGRLVMHPDAIDHYHVVYLRNIKLSNTHVRNRGGPNTHYTETYT